MAKEGSGFSDNTNRIYKLDLDANICTAKTPNIDIERKVAIYDLIEDNYFAPVDKKYSGPYSILLKIELRRRLFIEISGEDQCLQGQMILLLSEFRIIIKEYFQVCDCYYEAIKKLTPSQIESIDMARRGLHNDGAKKLQKSLSDQATINNLTARRLFTLLCIIFTR